MSVARAAVLLGHALGGIANYAEEDGINFNEIESEGNRVFTEITFEDAAYVVSVEWKETV